MVVEVPPVAILPNFVVQNKMLRPFRYQTGGTILVRWMDEWIHRWIDGWMG